MFLMLVNGPSVMVKSPWRRDKVIGDSSVIHSEVVFLKKINPDLLWSERVLSL